MEKLAFTKVEEYKILRAVSFLLDEYYHPYFSANANAPEMFSIPVYNKTAILGYLKGSFRRNAPQASFTLMEKEAHRIFDLLVKELGLEQP